MSDKMSEVYEAYDIELIRAMRGRGAMLLATKQGLFHLQTPEVSENRLLAEYQFKERLYDAGFTRIDRCMKNKHESLVTFDRYNNPYVLRSYFEARECNVTNPEEVRLAVMNLANFHMFGRKVWKETEGDVHVRVTVDFRRRNQELKRVRTFVTNRRPKREFETLYLDVYEHFYEQALRCEELYMQNANSHRNKESFECHIGYCHGMYNQHSVLIEQLDNEELLVDTVGFDKFHVGNQLGDLYHFLRKTVEKNNYSVEVMQEILSLYHKQCPLSEQDINYIYNLYSYPEKFYKISNQYMNAPKNWISPKMEEKLRKLVKDEEKKALVLEKLSQCKIE
ncbi:MAG: hypothetical protein PUA62_01730 [Lachnospiraceae bacterium]|nr:hypothetical protein [Lachnospiraceae bacterium]